ncbi:MAG: L,D-transpeptidase family protein [Gaiella sp.]
MGLRTLVTLAAAMVAVTFASLAGAARQATVSPPSVVGSGTIAWSSIAPRTAPSTSAPRVTVLPQFRPDYRPQVVMAIEAKLSAEGTPTWYRISIPGRPNGRTGWVPAASLELQNVDRSLVVYRGARRFEFRVGDKIVRTGRIAVGAPGAETPLGLFYVTWRFKPKAPILGAFAFETSAYSNLTDWPGGGIVGVHGTNSPWLLGQAVSHGCVRMHDRDAMALSRLMKLGTPILIRA